jgi:hypothetical protein
MSDGSPKIFRFDDHGRLAERYVRTFRSFLRQLGAAGA